MTIQSVQGIATDPDQTTAEMNAKLEAIRSALNIFLTSQEQTDNAALIFSSLLSGTDTVILNMKVKTALIKVIGEDGKATKQPQAVVMGKLDYEKLAERLAGMHGDRAKSTPKILLFLTEPEKTLAESDAIAEAIVAVRLASQGFPAAGAGTLQGYDKWLTTRFGDARRLSDDKMLLLGRACWADAVVAGTVARQESSQNGQCGSDVTLNVSVMNCLDGCKKTYNFTDSATDTVQETAFRAAILSAAVKCWPEVANGLREFMPGIQGLPAPSGDDSSGKPSLAIFSFAEDSSIPLGAETAAMICDILVGFNRYKVLQQADLALVSDALLKTRGKVANLPLIVTEAGRIVGSDLAICGVATNTNKTTSLDLDLSSVYAFLPDFSQKKERSSTTLDLCMAECSTCNVIWQGSFQGHESIKETKIVQNIGLPIAAKYGTQKGESKLDSRVRGSSITAVNLAGADLDLKLKFTGKVLLVDENKLIISPSLGDEIAVGSTLIIYRREGCGEPWDYTGCDDSCKQVAVATVTAVNPDAIEATVDPGVVLQEGDFVEWQKPLPVETPPGK